MAGATGGWSSWGLVVAALAALGPGPRGAQAAEGDPEPLFTRVLEQDGRCEGGLDPDCLVTPQTPRVSVVQVRTSLLLAVEPGSARVVEFNLFPDVRLEGWIAAPEPLSDGSLRWRAGLTGDPLASVVIVASAPGDDGTGRRLALLVRSPRRGSYDVRPHPADVRYSLIEARDPRRAPPCGVGRDAESTSTLGPGGTPSADRCRCVPAPPGPTLPVRPPPYSGEPGTRTEREVTLLVLYTWRTVLWADRSGDQRAIQATLQAHVDNANTYSRASDARTALRAVDKRLLDYGAEERTTLGRIWTYLRTPGDRVLDDAHRLRDRSAADLVTLVVRKDNAAYGGWGDVYPDRAAPADRPAYAFSVVRNVALGDDTLAHELGHNLGCCHADVAPDPPCRSISYRHPFPFTDGAGQAAVTLLGVWPDPAAPDDPPRVRYPLFSNPDLRVDRVAIGDRRRADNARMIREVVTAVSGYR